MTRSTRKSSTGSSTVTRDNWGQPVVVDQTTPPADDHPFNVVLPSDLYFATYGHKLDPADKAQWDEAIKLWHAYDAQRDKKASSHDFFAKTPRKVYVPEPPPTFADDCEDTPVPMTKLLEILAYQRFAGTQGEADMINSIITPLPGIDRDKYGNYWLRIPCPDGTDSTTLFSSHTDTVEKQKAKGLKELELKGAMLTTKGGGVLGADDGAGIWLMLNLIEAGVPGLYIFHREEELGGGGSSHIAEKTPELLTGIKRAIAFDRKDLNHIITHQGGERCASDAFAKAFAAQLNDACEGFDFHGDDTGSFTDTKNYTELVSECTNLSVGYYDQHTQHECLDLSFVTRLANALIKVEWELLPAERDPAEVEDSVWDHWKNYGKPSKRSNDLLDDDLLDDDAMTDLILDHPEAVAQILKDCGYDLYGVEHEIERIEKL